MAAFSEYPRIMQLLASGQSVPTDLLRWYLTEIMSGKAVDNEVADFLLAIRRKGESVQEVTCAAAVLREHMLRWDPGRPDIVDTCGTGGDAAGTFNISTAAAIVAAGAGALIVKHGNRAFSSRTGSADVLEALGVRIDGDADFARLTLRETNFAFCFAPRFHPAMKHVAAVRRRLGSPTIFNLLGPLANPAGTTRQIIGVGRPELLDLLAGALAQLGTTHAFVIHSQDGLDEISLAAPTMVREIRCSDVTPWEWTTVDFGLEKCSRAALSAPTTTESAGMMMRVLEGEDGPALRVVVANAAAALLVGGPVSSLRDGVDRAREAIRSGQARQVLARLQRLSASSGT